MLAASLLADQITLKNGDRITGTIVKKDGKTLTIKTDAFGVITTPWEKVQGVTTNEPVHVDVTGGGTLVGTVQTKDEKVEVSGVAVPLDQVTAVRNEEEQHKFERLLTPSWRELWAGTVSLGVAGTNGNAETLTLNAGLNAARVTRNDKTSVYFNAIKASAVVDSISAETARAVRGGWAYNRNVTSRFLLNAFNDYEFDRFQNLDLRFVLGGGVGYTAIKAERSRLDLLIGGAFDRESFAQSLAQPGFVRKSAESYAGDDFTFKMNSTTSLNQSFRFFNNLTDLGAFRFNFDLGANTKITKWLTWNTSLSDRYLSNPVPGRIRNDFLYSTGIGLTFSR